MDDYENAAKADVLRLELKTWEKGFGLANGGRKPERHDIKKDPVISAKYKQYQNLQKPKSIASVAQSPRTTKIREPLRETYDTRNPACTPKKTPSAQNEYADLLVPELSPERQVEPTPAFIRRALGPTPQKDGQVLGIFDIAFSATPSRAKDLSADVEEDYIVGTPSKKYNSSPGFSLSRTPPSTSKQFLFSTFAGTPLKRKREDADDPASGRSESSSKRRFATPSFLRRSFPLTTIEEQSAEHQVGKHPPFKKRGLVRSLSSIIQGLKRQEEERMDEELDMLNELEDEAQGITRSRPPAEVLVEDSQRTELPLGPDRAAFSEDDSPDQEDTDKARKPWKKKGLKRQTRRVIMRPVTHKPQKATDLSRIEENEAEIVDESQVIEDASRRGPKIDRATDLDYETDDKSDGIPGEHTRLSKPKPCSEEGRVARQHENEPPLDRPPAKTRKVNPLAHANFRKLKIKNKNSKANGRGRKFGGRR